MPLRERPEALLASCVSDSVWDVTSAFRDPGVEPTTERIQAALGPAGVAWNELATLLTESGLDLAWKYYRDGGWLARATRGSRTIAWLSAADGHARVTFYFAERHRATLVTDPALPADLRERVAAAALIGRLLPVTVEVRKSLDVREIGAVLLIKLGAR